MKTMMLMLSLLSLMAFQIGCTREADTVDRGIEREEALEGTDFRENDSYQTVPAEEEIEVDRDVMGDDEIELND